jgi:hypothetical protein
MFIALRRIAAPALRQECDVYKPGKREPWFAATKHGTPTGVRGLVLFVVYKHGTPHGVRSSR